MKVLVFNPYGHLQHNFHELVLGKKFEQHGHEVRYLSCKNELSYCDNRKACTKCNIQKRIGTSWLDIHQDNLKKNIKSIDLHNYFQEIENLHLETIKTYTFNGYKPYALTESSLCTDLRITKVDFQNPLHLQTSKKFMKACVQLIAGLEKYFEAFTPDFILTFNGRMFPFQTLLQFAQKHKVQSCVFEQGLEKNTFSFTFNHKFHVFDHFIEQYKKEKNTPIPGYQVTQIKNMFHRMRRAGSRTTANHNDDSTYLRSKKYFLQKTQKCEKTFIILPSSEDEHAYLPGYEHVFGNYEEWIRQTVSFFRNHPQYFAFIRFHPNSTNTRGAEKSILAFIQSIEKDLPNNISIINPKEPVNTYMLMDISDVAVTAGTTASLEMVHNNKPALIVRNCIFYHLPFFQQFYHPKEYANALNKLANTQVTHKDKIDFYRFNQTYLQYYSVPFSINKIHGTHVPQFDPTYKKTIEHNHDLEQIYHAIEQCKTGQTIHFSQQHCHENTLDEEQIIKYDISSNKKLSGCKKVLVINQDKSQRKSSDTFVNKLLCKRNYIVHSIFPTSHDTQKEWASQYCYLLSLVFSEHRNFRKSEYFHLTIHIYLLFLTKMKIRKTVSNLIKKIFLRDMLKNQVFFYNPDYIFVFSDRTYFRKIRSKKCFKGKKIRNIPL